MNKVKKYDADWYLSEFQRFERSLNGGSTSSFHQTRGDALAKFLRLGFPSTRDEEWKYTNIAPLLQHQFHVALTDTPVPPTREFLIADLEAMVLVFVNGRLASKLLPQKLANGVVVDSLSNALASRYDLVTSYLAQYADFQDNCFAALNTAFVHDGAFIYVPRNTVVMPIHLIYIADSKPVATMNHLRNNFVVESNSSLSVIESYHGSDCGQNFTNVVTEAIVKKNAQLEEIKLQRQEEKCYHIENRQVYQQRDSIYTSINIDLGAQLVRNNLNVLLNDENCETNLYGLYLANHKQHIDNHTLIDHARPHCHSNELYKGILSGKATGVFNGKVMVRPDAQKTKAFQSNQNLLLSANATVNTKPQLEIFADDVRCTHGATVGELAADALFYLKSRGISEEQANSILRFAFISDIVDSIKLAPVRREVENQVHAALNSM